LDYKTTQKTAEGTGQMMMTTKLDKILTVATSLRMTTTIRTRLMLRMA